MFWEHRSLVRSQALRPIIMKKQLITLGLVGFMLAPVKWTLHGTHVVAEEIHWQALKLELKLFGY